MTAWISGIIGVIALSILIDILLPEGETSKYIKGFVAVFVVAVIVAPLPAFINKDWKLEDFADTQAVIADGDYVRRVVEMQAESDERRAESLLAEKGYENVQVVILAKEANIYIIESMQIDLTGCQGCDENSAAKVREIISKVWGDIKTDVIGYG